MAKMRGHRLLLLVTLVVACVLVFTACSSGNQAPEGTTEEEQSTEPANAEARRIRKIVVWTEPKAEVQQDYESARIIVDGLKQLGLDADLSVMPDPQYSNVIWYERERWDACMWRMVGRPERMDPDELIFNLFHSSTIEDGYNFVGYFNPEYNEVAEAQRVETDQNKRRELVYEAQEIIARDQPYVYIAHPKMNYVFNNEVFDPATVVDAKGLGIKNFWTFTDAVPITDQKDLILNTMITLDKINPLYIAGEQPSWVTELIWDRLMRMGPEGLPEPYAAKSVEWIDDTTVEVVIRDDMKWHDGQPVTIDDVKFSFEAPMGEEAPMYAPFVAPIDNIEVVDDVTIRFHLKVANAAFLTSALAKINLIPKHIWEPLLEDLAGKPENAESIQNETPIGSGPFKWEYWRKSEELALTANKDHWDAPKIDHWIFRVMPNSEAVIGAMKTGELNFLSDYSGDPEALKNAVDQDPKLTLVQSVDVGSRFFALNNRRPPFDDAAFRQAVSMVMDRNLIIKSVFRDYAVPSYSIISPAISFWNNPDLTKWDYDIEAARQHLADAGYEWDSEGRLLYPEGQVEELTSE